MAAEKAAVKRGSYYTIDGDSIIFEKKFCPRCGPGIILADHTDRIACGKCGYTEFKK